MESLYYKFLYKAEIHRVEINRKVLLIQFLDNRVEICKDEYRRLKNQYLELYNSVDENSEQIKNTFSECKDNLGIVQRELVSLSLEKMSASDQLVEESEQLNQLLEEYEEKLDPDAEANQEIILKKKLQEEKIQEHQNQLSKMVTRKKERKSYKHAMKHTERASKKNSQFQAEIHQSDSENEQDFCINNESKSQEIKEDKNCQENQQYLNAKIGKEVPFSPQFSLKLSQDTDPVYRQLDIDFDRHSSSHLLYHDIQSPQNMPHYQNQRQNSITMPSQPIHTPDLWGNSPKMCGNMNPLNFTSTSSNSSFIFEKQLTPQESKTDSLPGNSIFFKIQNNDLNMSEELIHSNHDDNICNFDVNNNNKIEEQDCSKIKQQCIMPLIQPQQIIQAETIKRTSSSIRLKNKSENQQKKKQELLEKQLKEQIWALSKQKQEMLKKKIGKKRGRKPKNNNLIVSKTIKSPIFCYCQKEETDEMVQCDNIDCKQQWFHYGCIGLDNNFNQQIHDLKEWYCKECKPTQ